MVAMQNSKVKELMSSLEKVEVNEASEALSEAWQPAVRITTSKRVDVDGSQGKSISYDSHVQLVIPGVRTGLYRASMGGEHASPSD